MLIEHTISQQTLYYIGMAWTIVNSMCQSIKSSKLIGLYNSIRFIFAYPTRLLVVPKSIAELESSKMAKTFSFFFFFLLQIDQLNIVWISYDSSCTKCQHFTGSSALAHCFFMTSKLFLENGLCSLLNPLFFICVHAQLNLNDHLATCNYYSLLLNYEMRWACVQLLCQLNVRSQETGRLWLSERDQYAVIYITFTAHYAFCAG